MTTIRSSTYRLQLEFSKSLTFVTAVVHRNTNFPLRVFKSLVMICRFRLILDSIYCHDLYDL